MPLNIYRGQPRRCIDTALEFTPRGPVKLGLLHTARDSETFTLSKLAHIVGPYPRLACDRDSGSWSSALSRRFKSRAPTISAVLRMRMEHSQRTIRAQSACSEAKEVKHGTMGLRCVLSRPGVGHLTRHCPPARCLWHHVKRRCKHTVKAS